MTTKENAQEAFEGESQANRKYAVFAEKADAEGFQNVAKLFRAASLAEAIHAGRLMDVLGMKGSTEENLAGSVMGETAEFTEMYPAFVKTAQEEGNSEARMTFTHAMKAEEDHAGHYSAALGAVKSGTDLDMKAVYLCPYCGNIEFNEAPERCPICGLSGSKFRLVE